MISSGVDNARLSTPPAQSIPSEPVPDVTSAPSVSPRPVPPAVTAGQSIPPRPVPPAVTAGQSSPTTPVPPAINPAKTISSNSVPQEVTAADCVLLEKSISTKRSTALDLTIPSKRRKGMTFLIVLMVLM